MKQTVIVTGAGLAGCMTAILLARRGFAVQLIDRKKALEQDDPKSFTRLETLPGAGVRILREANLNYLLNDRAHRPSAGIASAWGDSPPVINDNIRDPYGPSWIVDRGRLTEQLCEAANAAGISILPAQRVSSVQLSRGSVKVFVQSGSEVSCLEGQFAVDATGKSAAIGRRLGASQHFIDKQLAIEAILARQDSAYSHTDLSLVESTAFGWWYAVYYPCGNLYVLFVPYGNVDRIRDYMSATGLTKAAMQTKLLSYHVQSINTTHPSTRLRTVALTSSRLSPVSGTGYIAVGDASITFDPISSQGMFHCLYTATKATEALSLAAREEALELYSIDLERIWQSYCNQRRRLYQDINQYTVIDNRDQLHSKHRSD